MMQSDATDPESVERDSVKLALPGKVPGHSQTY